MINNINTRKAGVDSINVFWEFEDSASVMLCNVIINNSGICKTIGVDPELKNLTIPNLKINSVYEIQVKALTKNGWQTSKIIEATI